MAMLATAAFSWAGSSVAGRAAAGNIPPMTLSILRWTGALLIFLPFGAAPLWRQRSIVAAHWPLLCLFAVFGIVGFSVPLYLGLQTTTAINATLLNSLGPLMIVLLSVVMLRHRVSPRRGLGIALGFAGALAILVRGEPAMLASLKLHTGDLLVMTAFLCWAFYTVLLRWRPAGLSESAFLVAITGMSVVMLLPLLIWELGQGATFEASPGNLTILGYVIVFPSALGYVCWNLGVATLGQGAAAATQYLIPVFGVILAMLVLGEAVRFYHLAGIGAIFVGVYLGTGRRRE